MNLTDLSQQEKDNILLATKEYIVFMQEKELVKTNIPMTIYWVGSFIDGDADEFSDYDILVVVDDENSLNIRTTPNYFKIVSTGIMRLHQKYGFLHPLDIRIRTESKFLTDKSYLLLEEIVPEVVEETLDN